MSRINIRQLTKFILFNLVVLVLAFMLVEGGASTVLLVQNLLNTRPVAERLHTKYDPQLGWVNIPNTYIEDMYGPGLYLKINSQGFRNSQDFTVDIPKDKVRFICSGDSFTFGFGVNNDQTWCQRLATLDPRLETVNMGQGGYGIGQTYLWYKRDGGKLAHNVQLFAFITTDFERMQYDQFLGYGKPVLTVKNNKLVVKNVPVPERAFFIPWLTQNQDAFNNLKSVQLLRETFFQDHPNPVTSPEALLDGRAVRDVSWYVLKDLEQINRDRGSTLVLLYLPVQADYEAQGGLTDSWRQYVHQAAAQDNLLLIDLIDDFRQLSPQAVNELFIPDDGSLDFPGAAGHYSAKGNEYIANLLYQKLLAQPEISNMLNLKDTEISHVLTD